ncbi:2-oxoglutarate dehydrogenase E1 component [Coemansia sp. S3946]|nr:2-oxoglutarate dehydrogenase E1 component [Coemansia sp. S3946]
MVHKGGAGRGGGRKNKPPGRYLTRNYNNDSHDDFSQLNRALKKAGLYCKDMAGDGNCLFRALADQTDGTPDTHLRHREAVCDYMSRHPDEFAPFLDESCSFDRYTDNMRHQGVFGGNLELVAFARNYRVDIKVYQLGGTVFVISGAPANDPTEVFRSMPTVHIAYHSYEHYSSVRNSAGPYDGLPDVNESRKLPRSFVAVLNSDPTGIIPTVDNASPEDEANNDDTLPTVIEKIIMDSTGVDNHPLVRHLLRKHRQNSDRVIELLIQWMGDESSSTAEPWWTKDGPATYDGPKATPKTPETTEADQTAAQTADEATDPNAPDNNDSENTPNKIAEPPAAKPNQHKKGAARQKKAESKKRQKEMAKLKKRTAARQEAQAHSPSAKADVAEQDAASRMAHIYI